VPAWANGTFKEINKLKKSVNMENENSFFFLVVFQAELIGQILLG